MMNKNNASRRINFNLLKYFFLCLKSWRLFVACIIGCVVVAGAFAVFQIPKSQVMAQLMLKDDAGAGSSMMLAGQIARSFSLGDMFGGSSSTDNETLVLGSHAVMIGTVKDLGLNTTYFKRRLGIQWVPIPQNSPFRLIVPDQMSDTIGAKLVFNVHRLDNGRIDVEVKKKNSILAKTENQALPASVNTSYGNFIIDKTAFYDTDKASDIKINYETYSDAAQTLMKQIKIYVPDRKTDFIDISLVTSDPKYGIKMLNTLIDNYIEVSNLYKLGRTSQTLKLVEDRLEKLTIDINDSERSLEKFKLDNKLTDVEVDAQFLISKTGTLEASLLEAQTKYELLKLTKDFLSNPENQYSLIPELISSGANDNDPGLISSYNNMILERMELLNSAKTNNAVVKQMDEQIDAMRANIVASVERMFLNASVALRDIKVEDGRTRSRISELPTLEREYVSLKRDNILLEQMYLFLLQQREELNMNINSTSYPAQIVDAPYILSEEPGLSKKMLLLLGVFFGFALAAVYVFLFRMKKSPVIAASEINAILDAPTIQQIFKDTDSEDTLEIVGDGKNSETFRRLRTDVQFALNSFDGKVIAVTSMNASEGKTFVAVNLAASLAAIGKKTLLVDASLRSPKVASLLGISNPPSALANYVMSTKDPSKVELLSVRVNDRSSMDVITASPSAVNASDVIASDRFPALIDSLKTTYDYVVIDSSSVKAYSDVFHITDLADITLMVCRVKIISPEDIEQINTIFSNGRLKRLVVVENCVK